MKDLKEYIIPEDLKPGQLPHTLAWYDEETLVKDWMKEHPDDTITMCIGGLMKFARGRLNPITLKRILLTNKEL